MRPPPKPKLMTAENYLVKQESNMEILVKVYPITPAARKVIQAQVKCSIAT